MQTFEQTFAGATTWRLDVPGKYFTILECTAAVNVTFFKGGKKLELGQISALLAGLEVTLGEIDDPESAFDRVEVGMSGANTVKIGIGNGQARYNRSQGSVQITNFNGSVANTAKTVTTTSAQLVAANASRRYLLIQNKDAAGVIYVNFGAGAATTANGVKIAAGGSFSADSSFCPNTAIQAIGDIASNANVVVVEG